MQDDSLIVCNEYPKEGPIALWLKRRIKHKKTALVVILGESGSGKSMIALRVAEQTDPAFSAERIVYDIDSFMNLLTSGELRPGSVVVFEEAGVNLSAAQWYDIQIKLFAYVLQTFRKLQVIVIFTVPHFGFIAPSFRSQMNLQIITQHIDFEKKLCNAEVRFLLKWSWAKSKNDYDVPYTHFKIWIKNEGIIKDRTMDFLLPSQQLIDAYEGKKDEYIAKLNKDISQTVQERTTGGWGVNKNNVKLTENQQKVLDLYPDHSIKEIAQKLNVSVRVGYHYIQTLRAKGILLKKKYKAVGHQAKANVNNSLINMGEENLPKSL